MKYKIIILFLIIIFISGCELSDKCKSDCSVGYYCIDNNCVSECGDNICTEDEKEFCCKDCGIEELEMYPKELDSAFINSRFSDDCMIQKNEKEILNKTMILFKYDSLKQIKDKILETNELTTLLELLYDYNPYKKEDEQIYITNIAHMLWLEEKNILPWSIKSYNKENINYLIEKGNNTQWILGAISKEYLKLFPLSINFIESDKEKTVKSIIEWEMKNFFHASEEYEWEVYNKTSDESIHIPLKNIFKERVVDCHIASHILIGMLRSINIPAQKMNFKGHGVTFIPDLNLYVHGDYIADFAVNPDILMTKEELESYVYSEEGYNKFWNENQHKYPKLKRKGNKLYVEEILQTEKAKSEENINFIKESLKEYNLTFKETETGGIEISSDFIEIKEL